jgi:ABC-2 type transport system permease protein
VFLSGAVGVSIVQLQSFGYYIMMILSAFLVPVLPLCVSCFIGVGVSAIVSRLKKGKLVGSILLCLLACGIMALSYKMPEQENEFISAISDLIKAVCSIYPPALWISQGVLGESVLPYILFALSSVLLGVIFVAVVAKVYMRLCILLGSTHTQNQKIDIQKSKTNTPFIALYKREFKRLFTSTVYFTNTLLGNIMAIIGAIALLFVDASMLNNAMGAINIGEFAGVVVLGAVSIFANMAPITTASIGIEGKSFDLTKSLPVSAKTLLLAKLVAGLTFSVPTSIVVTCLLLFSPIYVGASLVLMILSPLVFSVVMPTVGLFMNIKFPSLKWTNEQVPVKQGKAVLFTMLFTFVVGLGYIALGVLVGEIALYGLLLAVSVIAFVLYENIIKTDLRKIN